MPYRQPWIRFWYPASISTLTGMPGGAFMLAMPVTTTVPPLAIASNACATCSPVTTSIVTIALSAPWPSVIERAYSAAWSMWLNVLVAPSLAAISSLNATGSTAITDDAPASAAPCTALMPTPPTPMMITTSPVRTLAALTADPNPVPTPHPSRHTVSRGTSSGTLTSDSSGTVLQAENVEISMNWLTSRPS